MNLGTVSCKPVPTATGVNDRSVNNFSGKGKPRSVCWSAWDWILEFEFGPSLLRPAGIAKFGKNGWIRYLSWQRKMAIIMFSMPTFELPSCPKQPFFAFVSLAFSLSKCQIF